MLNKIKLLRKMAKLKKSNDENLKEAPEVNNAPVQEQVKEPVLDPSIINDQINEKDFEELQKRDLNKIAQAQRQKLAEEQQAHLEGLQAQKLAQQQANSTSVPGSPISEPINLHPASDQPPQYTEAELEALRMQQAQQKELIRQQALREEQLRQKQNEQLVQIVVVFEKGVTKSFSVPLEALVQVKQVIVHNLANSKTFEIANSLVISDKVLFIDFGE